LLRLWFFGFELRSEIAVVENTVHFILHDPAVFRNFLAVRSFDHTTYTHCVDVYVYSIALAERLGVEEASDLQVLGTGALLHDIGKSRIDKSILNKNGPLSGDEWTIVRKHPIDGVEMLRKAGGVADDSYAVVSQHHERCDGSGYPEGLTKDKIHLYGRISGIVDVFRRHDIAAGFPGRCGKLQGVPHHEGPDAQRTRSSHLPRVRASHGAIDGTLRIGLPALLDAPV